MNWKSYLESPSNLISISALFDTEEVFLLHQYKLLCSQKSLDISSGNYGCMWTELLTCGEPHQLGHWSTKIRDQPVCTLVPSCPETYAGHTLIQEADPCSEVTYVNGSVPTPRKVSCINSSQSLLTIVKIDPGVAKQELRAVVLPQTSELYCKLNMSKIRSQSDYSLWKQPWWILKTLLKREVSYVFKLETFRGVQNWEIICRSFW